MNSCLQQECTSGKIHRASRIPQPAYGIVTKKTINPFLVDGEEAYINQPQGKTMFDFLLVNLGECENKCKVFYLYMYIRCDGKFIWWSADELYALFAKQKFSVD